jgi:FkbM family methyltransferase
LNTKDSESSRFFCKTLGDEAELKLTKFFIKNLKENDVFYDIGANYGFYSCLATEFCKEVHLFEPSPRIINYLKKNILKYSNVFLNNLAVSNKNEIIEIYFDKKSSGITTSNKNAIKRLDFNLDKREKTRAITLDEYIKNHPYPTIIKIDIEGSEKMAIEGGKDFLKNESPIIAMEIWSQKNNGEISTEAVEKLKDYGYKSYFINRDGTLKEVEGNLPKIITFDLFDNFIFKK